MLQAKKLANSNIQGIERVNQHKHFVCEALAKLMRKSASFLNARDEAALKDFIEHFDLYVLNDLTILERVNRLYRQKLDENASLGDFE